MKYAHYDETNGKILGWYDSEIHKTIPTPNIEVSETDWQVAIDNNYNSVDTTTGALSFKDFRTLDELKFAKISEINNACSSQIVSGFTSTALDTATPTTYHYQSEQIDQLNLIGLVSGGIDDALKCSKDDGNGNPTTWNYELHTIAQLIQVLNDGKAYKISLLTKAANLKAQAQAAATQDDLDAIVW